MCVGSLCLTVQSHQESAIQIWITLLLECRAFDEDHLRLDWIKRVRMNLEMVCTMVIDRVPFAVVNRGICLYVVHECQIGTFVNGSSFVYEDKYIIVLVRFDRKIHRHNLLVCNRQIDVILVTCHIHRWQASDWLTNTSAILCVLE